MARDQLLRRALALSLASIALNGIVGTSAVLIALTIGSLSLLGFGFDAAIDSAASIALVGRFRLEASQPHRAERVETVAEAIVGGVLLILAVYLGSSAARALVAGAHPEATVAGTILLVFSVVVLPPLAIAK